MKEIITELITQKVNPKVDQLLNLLNTLGPALNCELVSLDPPILVIDFDQEAVWDVLPYLDGGCNTLPGSDEPLIKWRVKDLYPAGLIDIEDSVELSHEGDSVLILPRSAYSAGDRPQRKDALMREKVRPYLELEAESEERFAAEALCGEIPFVTPVLAGLKPVAFYSCGLDVPQDELEPLLRKIMQKDPDHFFIKPIKNPYRTKEETILLFYNPAMVRHCLRQHASLFALFGFTEASSPEQVVDFFVQQTSLKLEMENVNRMHALGLLLGYDEKSAIDFATQASSGLKETMHLKSLPLWGVDYHVSEFDVNSDFKDLYASYETLRQRIETELGKGQTPSEVLNSLPLYSESNATKKTVARVIP